MVATATMGAGRAPAEGDKRGPDKVPDTTLEGHNGNVLRTERMARHAKRTEVTAVVPSTGPSAAKRGKTEAADRRTEDETC